MSRLSLALLVAVACDAAAQHVDSVPLSRVPVGAEIRVWTQAPPLRKWRFLYTGSLPGAISVAEQPGSAALKDFRPVIQFADLRRLETNLGRKQSKGHFLKSTLVGAAVGTFVGVAIGLSVDKGIRNPANDDPLALMLFGGGGLAVGSLAGVIAGAQGAVVWAPVSLRR